ncbi:alpha-L-rhamnosidase [Lactobacillus colini]|uniref:alpha-L-rhamnosidase n=1 Tax=Lactobacillus colini TaxID=1819254 RepID=A0ABS4MBS4_9LACO|nr:alpha-L-rhamnosidase [Lactobacillus colini]MBP2057135.1 alpha-L-rhamnosidase [Lactobacillus colini]
MQIEQIEINHMENPLGFDLNNHLHIVGFISDIVNNIVIERKLEIIANQKIVYETKWENAKNLIFDFPLQLKPRTRYTVSLSIRNEKDITTKTTWFETGYLNEPLHGKWIGNQEENVHSIILSKNFQSKSVKNARLYVTGLGLFEAYIDGQKIGDEFLAPGFTNYNYRIQRETYDITNYLKECNEHTLSIMLGDGWYRGKLGLKTHGGQPNNYGNNLMAIADLVIDDQIISTDESWKMTTSPVTHSGIYYGEDLDDNYQLYSLGSPQVFKVPTDHVVDRQSLPITKHEEFKVKEIIHTPHGSTVLDFGQNLSGWLEFRNVLPSGDKINIEFGEIMQNGEFYRENLRSARAQLTYVSDGKEKWIRPHFTYFGFRYVKLNDFPSEIKTEDFKAVALYSDMRDTGYIETDDKAINRLFKNVKWSQKSNFIDIPTDCPQRDERLGWSGDAAIFAQTASYNMETYAFFKKFAYDIAVEQSKNEGKVPLYVPAVDTEDGGKAVWSDAATIIPWVSYQRSQDPAILEQNIGAMMSWVDWVHERAVANGNEYLWLNDDQLGDWLALDTEDIMKLKGKTPDDLIASAYYYYSAQIVSNAAKVLNMKHESQYYGQLAKLIKQAFIKHFFTTDGLGIADTQTGLSICLEFKLYPENAKDKLINKLVEKIESNQNHLDTGFVGTPLLLPALSESGQSSLALRLFLTHTYPSWLFEVDHGATTIWERWNSVDENGIIANNGMNSLNHYSSGAVMTWAHQYLVGLRQCGNNVIFKPLLTSKLKQVRGQIQLPTGLVKVKWQILNTKKVKFDLEIPFGNTLKLDLPQGKVLINDTEIRENVLVSGNYKLEFIPADPIVECFDVHTPIEEFSEKLELTNQLKNLVPFWEFLEIGENMKNFSKNSLYQLGREMRGIGFKPLNNQDIEKINNLFKEYSLQEEE